MIKGKSWSAQDMAELRRQRANGVPVLELSIPGRTQRACRQALYRSVDYQMEVASRKDRVAEARASNEARPKCNRRKQQPPQPPPIAPPVPVPAPVQREAPMWHLSHLRQRAELQNRILERGLTGGVFGDPPPGRSALDERRKSNGPAPT